MPQSFVAHREDRGKDGRHVRTWALPPRHRTPHHATVGGPVCKPSLDFRGSKVVVVESAGQQTPTSLSTWSPSKPLSPVQVEAPRSKHRTSSREKPSLEL